MKNGICPKCNSSEVHFYERELASSSAFSIMTFFKGREKSYDCVYLCLDCGYVETYINLSEDDRTKIQDSEYWKRASKRKNDE